MASIVDSAAAVRSGERSAVDGIDDALRAAEALQPRLNAFTSIDRQGAIARAQELDRRIEKGEDVGPLAGIPIGLKDLIDQSGIPNTNGAAFDPVVPETSATVVDRLEAAGAEGTAGSSPMAIRCSSSKIRLPYSGNMVSFRCG